MFALPAKLIEREMALTLEHLGRSRRTKSESMKELESIRQFIDNRLVNLRRLPYEPSDRWIERDKIRNQLTNAKVRLESQRLRVILNYSLPDQIYFNVGSRHTRKTELNKSF